MTFLKKFMPTKLNPFVNSNPMSWEDAAKISLILTAAKFFIVFMPIWGYQECVTNLGHFVFEAIIFFGGAFFTDFVVLAGLTKYISDKSKEEAET